MRRLQSRSAAILALVCAAVVFAPAPDARAAARPVAIEGRGFGHGRGMSQWGARGMAERGASWRTIVSHYYRGTHIALRPPGERIRALVATSPAVVVTSTRRFSMVWADGERIGMNDVRRRFVRVRRADAHYVVEYGASPSGPWRRATRSRRGVVFVRGRSPLEVVSGSSRAYRGTIEVRVRAGGALQAVNHLPLEEYVMGVVPREMPSGWPAAALRAQAVAARSYAVALKEQSGPRRAWDVCSTTACQVYGGLAAERPAASQAVLATARHVVTHGGRVALTEYSSSSGGSTAAGRQPYLRHVDDAADRISPNHTWVKQIDASAIERSWPSIGRLRGVSVRSRDGAGIWGGRARLVRIAGSRQSVEVSGGTFAARMGLRSRFYRVRLPHPEFRFTANLAPRSRGRAVTELQRRLRENGLLRGPINGYYDTRTRDAVIRYQRQRRIRPTGTTGPLTRARLNAEAWP